MSLPFLKKRRKLHARLERLLDEYNATQPGGDWLLLDMVVDDPERAEEVVKLSVALGMEVTERVLKHFDLDVKSVREEYWGTVDGA